MEYIYSPYDPMRSASNLQYKADSGKLFWKAPAGQDTLVVQTPFGESAENQMEGICRNLSGRPSLPRQYTEIPHGSGVWLCAVSAAASVNGCPVNRGAGTYTVLSYSIGQGVCSIFAPPPPSQWTASAHENIQQNIHVDVFREVRQVRRGFLGLGGMREEDTGFYTISFPRDISGGYADGDMQYTVGDLAVPITRQMLEWGQVFVKTDRMPVVTSVNGGLDVRQN